MTRRKPVAVNWRWRTNVNSRNDTMRKRIGQWLRDLAERIDGRISLGVEILTEPEIGRARVLECIDQGIAAIDRAAGIEAKHVALDEGLKKLDPILFCDDDRDRISSIHGGRL